MTCERCCYGSRADWDREEWFWRGVDREIDERALARIDARNKAAAEAGEHLTTPEPKEQGE